MRQFALLLLATAFCVCANTTHVHAASFSNGSSWDAQAWGGNNVQFSKAKSGAFVDFVFQWGGHRGGVQKYMVMRGIMPRFDNAPFSFKTGTIIPLHSAFDLNPFNWTRNQKIGAITALGLGIWAISNHNRTSSRSYPTVSDGEAGDGDEDEDEDEDEDDDSDFFGEHDHCYDGFGEDGEHNSHCF